MSKSSEGIEALATPCLLLERHRMERNISRLKQRLHALSVGFRPHLKTAKSIDIARLLMPTASGPCTVSTLKEAEQFAAGGVYDILYAVGIAPGKLSRVVALRGRHTKRAQPPPHPPLGVALHTPRARACWA